MEIKNKYQLQILAWSYAVLFVLYAAMAAQVVSLVSILDKSDEWRQHSTEVIQSAAAAKTAFLEAETEGRYASFDTTARNKFPALREKSFAQIEHIASLVADNDFQSDNAAAIAQAVKTRFATQEKTINAAQIVNGTLQSNPELVKQGVNAQSEVINAFTRFELEEQRLLFDRYGKFWDALWSIAYILGGILAFSFLVSLTGGGWIWRTLKKAKAALMEIDSDEEISQLIDENKKLELEVNALKSSRARVAAILNS